MTTSRLQSVFNVVCLALLAASVLVLSPRLLNTDSAAPILLAAELLKSGNWLLSEDWYYVSDSLMLDGRVQIAMLAVLLFGPTVNAFVAMVGISAALALTACYGLSRVLGAKAADSATAGLVLLLGPSLIYQDIVLGLTISLQVALAMFFLATFIGYAFRQRPWPWLAMALLILFASTLSSPKKALAYLLLPVIAAIAVHAVLARGTRGDALPGRGRFLWLVPVLLLAAGAGHLGHEYLLRGLRMNSSYAELAFILEADHVLANVKLLAALFARFAGGVHSWLPWVSVLLVVVVTFCFICAPMFRRSGIRAFLTSAPGFVYAYSICGGFAILASLLAYNQIKIYYGIYYAWIPFAPLLPMMAWLAGSVPDDMAARVTKAGLYSLLLLGACNAVYFMAAFPDDYYGFSKNQKTTHRGQAEAIEWLLDRGIRHGYANLWDANALTLRSDGQLQVTSVLTPAGSGKLRRHHWLMDRERAGFLPNGENWFIAIPASRRAVSLPAACLPADIATTVGGYRIYTYHGAKPGCPPAPLR